MTELELGIVTAGRAWLTLLKKHSRDIKHPKEREAVKTAAELLLEVTDRFLVFAGKGVKHE